MWYYVLNNQTVGPVNLDTLNGLLQANTINLETLVWEQGMSGWQKLGLAINQQPVNTPAMNVPPALPQFATVRQFPGDRKRNIKSLQGLFIAWLVVFALATILPDFSILFLSKGLYSVPPIITGITGVAAGVLSFIIFGRCWRIVQDGNASMSVGKAIGFMFIPFFNFYWIFPAIHGLSDELNRYIDRHVKIPAVAYVRRAVPAFSLIYCIALLARLAYNLFSNIALRSGIFSGVIGMQVNQGINTAFTLFYCVASFLAITDFYLVGKSILAQETNAA
jgi:hypothetical protein